MFSFLFVDTERVWRGGQEQLLSLLEGLHKRAHRVHLVCYPNTLLEKRVRDIGIAVHPRSIRSEFSPVSFFRLLSVLVNVQPEILAFNTPRAILPGCLASRLSLVKTRIAFRRVNFPVRRNFFTRLKYTWGVDCVVAISESIRLQLQLCGIPSSKIETIYEGIDPSRYSSSHLARARTPGQPIIVGTVAHLSPEKGLNYLVEAAAKIPNVHQRMRFIIVGDGVCRHELQEQVRQQGLQSVIHFAGFHPDISPFMQSFDIFVLPSLSEGLSSAILEAMAASLPIVATKVGGIPELVIHGDNGLLVNPRDSEALARAIEHLAENHQQALRMGQRSRSYVEERFTLDKKIRAMEQLCARLLRERGSH